MTTERLTLGDITNASVVRGMKLDESLKLFGKFTVELIRYGKVVLRDEFPNTVMTLGRNLLLDSSLAGSSYSVTGPYIGLISSVSYTTGPAAGDTMSSHGGWAEAGVTNAPHYTIPRKTAVFSAAAAGVKALSSALAFSITTAGTLKGCFIVMGTGAVSTIDDTNGTLLSAGLFTRGDMLVDTPDVVNVSWQLATT